MSLVNKKPLVVEREIGQACCLPQAASRLSDAQSQELAAVLRALADPARLQILDILAQHAGEVCACDFEGRVGLPDARTGERPKQPTISHHLKVLREAGIVDLEKRGPWVYYFIRRERVAELKSVLDTLCRRC